MSISAVNNRFLSGSRDTKLTTNHTNDTNRDQDDSLCLIRVIRVICVICGCLLQTAKRSRRFSIIGRGGTIFAANTRPRSKTAHEDRRL